ncbi:OmpA family protein [Candidatus Dependentiae bacterium]|nr:OmpA family protein [Candidatus Dependentiae bacterium]
MNKQIIALALLLVSIPACCRRKKSLLGPTYTETCTTVTEEPTCPNKPTHFNEDINPFELDEDSNPFNTLANEADLSEEDMNLVNAEETTRDLQKDSASYGLKRIYYDFDQYDVRPDQEGALKHNLQIARKLADKGLVLVVEGHACNSAGSSAYNMMLSEKRAQALADYLVSNGVDESQLRVVGRGSELCIIPSGTRQQQAPNRRVEVYAYKA